MSVVVSPTEFVRLTGEPAQSRSKYGARKCKVHTPAHDSLKECRRWQELVLRERAGEIRNLRQQVVFELAPSVTLWGRKKPAIRFVADFTYEERTGDQRFGQDGWREVVEDCKGVQTPVFRMKAHLMAAQGRIVRLT